MSSSFAPGIHFTDFYFLGKWHFCVVVDGWRTACAQYFTLNVQNGKLCARISFAVSDFVWTRNVCNFHHRKCVSSCCVFGYWQRRCKPNVWRWLRWGDLLALVRHVRWPKRATQIHISAHAIDERETKTNKYNQTFAIRFTCKFQLRTIFDVSIFRSSVCSVMLLRSFI